MFALDQSTGRLFWRVKKNTRINVGDLAGSLAKNHGYWVVGLDNKLLLAHRIVFAMVHGSWPHQVDHINGVKTDNRPSNLRAASHADNQRNKRLQKTNTSGVKGVSWHKRDQNWSAQCKVNGRIHNLGQHKTIQAAEAAVRAFREQNHGEFARHE